MTFEIKIINYKLYTIYWICKLNILFCYPFFLFLDNRKDKNNQERERT